MMIWAPLFAIVTLFLFRRYSIAKLKCNECRLTADLSESEGPEFRLSEPQVLRMTGVGGGIRLQILIIVLLMFCCPVVLATWIRRPGVSDFFSPLWGVASGLFLAVALELLTLSGWVRFGLGSVLLDESKLVVPSLFAKKIYYPDRVRIWCAKLSDDTYSVLVVGTSGGQSLLYVDEQAICDLRFWIHDK